ncbi:MAG TPA: hypothetical protein VFK05_08155 [Polyangiaceae bacterium]|nr:hypothetical protein [Polyangiaceae bacterium]
MASVGKNGCEGCKDFVRFERVAPAGRSFSCPACGKRFCRIESKLAAEQVLDMLLLRADYKRSPPHPV